MKKMLCYFLLILGLLSYNSIHAQSSPPPPATQKQSTTTTTQKKPKISIKKIVGTWHSDETSVILKFFYDEYGEIQMMGWATAGGEEIEIVSLEVKGEQIITLERMPGGTYSIQSIYKMKSENTLICLEGEEKIPVTFKRRT